MPHKVPLPYGFDYNISVSKQTFFKNYKLIFREVEEVFETTLQLGKSSEFVVYNFLYSIIQLDTMNHPVDRDLELIKYGSLIAQLRIIKRYNPPVFTELKKKILGIKKQEHFSGTRLEIQIAAVLCLSKITFQMPDPPDFTFMFKGTELIIEVTSTQLARENNKSLLYKISRKINKKEGKPYACPKATLFLDYTNLIFNNNGLNPEFFQSEDLKLKVLQMLDPQKFGSVILFYSSFYRNQNVFKTSFNRIDQESIDPILKLFLDKHFPKGRIEFDLDELVIPQLP
jgi:hypothetical protein